MLRKALGIAAVLAVLAGAYVVAEDAAAPPAEAKPVTVAISAADGKGADTYVQSAKAEENLGGAKSMVVMRQPTNLRLAYVRFDISAMKEPVKGAVLVLPVVPNTGKDVAAFKVYGLNDGADDDWAEGTGTGAPPAATAAKKAGGEAKAEEPAPPAEEPAKPAVDGITFKTAPAADKKGVDEKKATLLGTLVVDNTDYRLTKGNIPVEFGSAEMVEWLGKDTNKLVTFIIMREQTSQTALTSFGTKEGKKPATLKLSSEPMPFPVQPPVTTQPATKPAAKPAE